MPRRIPAKASCRREDSESAPVPETPGTAFRAVSSSMARSGRSLSAHAAAPPRNRPCEALDRKGLGTPGSTRETAAPELLSPCTDDTSTGSRTVLPALPDPCNVNADAACPGDGKCPDCRSRQDRGNVPGRQTREQDGMVHLACTTDLVLKQRLTFSVTGLGQAKS